MRTAVSRRGAASGSRKRAPPPPGTPSLGELGLIPIRVVMTHESPASRAGHCERTRIAAVVLFAAIALAAIAWVFWDQDVRYSLPTPTPQGLEQPQLGTPVDLSTRLALPAAWQGRPLLLHFYNPDCPCSRFNADHVADLLQRYRDQVVFCEVLEADRAHADEDSGLGLRQFVDADGSLAKALGVYSTPQAVLLDGQHRIRFRGNYNTSRYCSDRNTEFVRLAIEALLAGQTYEPPVAATVSYGCELPDAEER